MSNWKTWVPAATLAYLAYFVVDGGLKLAMKKMDIAILLVRRPPSVTLRQLSATLFLFPALLAWNTSLYFDAALILATLVTSLVIHRPRPHFPEDSGVADVLDPVFARLWAFRCGFISVWYGLPSGIFSLCLVSICYSATRIFPYNSSKRNATHAAMHVCAVAGSVCVILSI